MHKIENMHIHFFMHKIQEYSFIHFSKVLCIKDLSSKKFNKLEIFNLSLIIEDRSIFSILRTILIKSMLYLTVYSVAVY